MTRHLIAAMLLAVASIASAQTLPDGPGAEIVRARCVACHGTEIIAGQRLSRQGWEREVNKMVGWGAAVQDAERAPLVEYLAAHFSPKPVAAHAPAAGAAGEATFTRACLTCHGREIVEQQRLTRAGWTREVDKMIRWGAAVSDEDKEGLVEFLAARYRP